MAKPADNDDVQLDLRFFAAIVGTFYFEKEPAIWSIPEWLFFCLAMSCTGKIIEAEKI